MQYRITLSVIFLICAAIAIAGCTGTQNVPSGQSTIGPTATQGSGQGSVDLVPVPTDKVPSDYMVYVDIGEKDYLGNIPVIFQGGMGQSHVTRLDVKLTRSDGFVKTVQLGIKKGDQIEFEGTKQTDRIEVWVNMNNGQRFKINDVQVPYRTRE